MFLADALNHPVQDIISKRVPEYTASHQVVFHSPYDSFSLQHSLHAPEMFIPGVIEAIAYIQRLAHGEVMLSAHNLPQPQITASNELQPA